MAKDWLMRAYGMYALDLDELDWAEEDQVRTNARDNLEALLDEFIDDGGSVDDLHDAVDDLIKEQRIKQNLTSAAIRTC